MGATLKNVLKVTSDGIESSAARPRPASSGPIQRGQGASDARTTIPTQEERERAEEGDRDGVVGAQRCGRPDRHKAAPA